MSKVKILLVEDEADVAEYIQGILKFQGYSVPDVIAYGEEAIEKAGETCPDLVLMDILLKGAMDGIEAAKHIQDRFNIPVIYLTGYADEKKLQQAKLTEPYGYILKPFKPQELHATIKMALYKHKLQNELRSRFSTVLRSIGDAVITFDKKGFITFMNPVAEALTGWKKEVAQGKALIEVFDVKDKDKIISIKSSSMKALFRGDIDSLTNESILISDGKKEIPIEFNVAAIRDDKGIISGFVLVFRDITERKRAETQRAAALEALQESEEKYHSLIASSEDPIYLVNSDLKYIYANKKLLSRFGKSQDEVFGQEYIKFHSPERTKLFSERIEEIFESRKPVFYEYHSLRDGRYFLRTLSPVMNQETREVIAVTVISKDITEIRIAEEQVRIANERLQHLLYSSSTIIYSSGISGDYGTTFISENVFVITGYLSGEFIKGSKFWIDRIHPEDRGYVLEEMSTISKKEYFTLEYRFQKKDGVYIWVYDSKRVIKDKNGVPVEIVGNILNITERKRAGEEARKMHQGLVEAHEKLQQAYEYEKQLRDKLIQSEKLASLGQMGAKIAHEINNPLTIISGRAQIYQMKDIDEKLRKTFDLIVKESLRIKNITSTYINLSRPTPARRDRLNLNEVIEECVDILVTTGETKYIKVEKNLQSDFPVVIGDRERLIHVFRILIANAIYAMADSEVKALTLRSSVSKDKRFVEVSIKDTGYGIAKKDFNKIFDIYYTTKPEGLGTGLGLVIVKDIIEKQHKGKVLVESEVSKGTTFTIQLPIEKKAKRKILVVDDEAFTRELFTSYFEEKGLDAFVAQNGEEALQYFEKIQPDIILSDIQMPVMDGFELAEKVRAKNPEQKIIFMTGYYFEHDIQSKLEKSNIRYFTKPADFDVVWEMISKELKSETP